MWPMPSWLNIWEKVFIILLIATTFATQKLYACRKHQYSLLKKSKDYWNANRNGDYKNSSRILYEGIYVTSPLLLFLVPTVEEIQKH